MTADFKQKWITPSEAIELVKKKIGMDLPPATLWGWGKQERIRTLRVPGKTFYDPESLLSVFEYYGPEERK